MNLAQTDIERFLWPISAAMPAGCNIEYEAIFEQINQARERDEGMFSDDAWECETRRADWTRVSRLCQQVLETQSKDLQIACWLTQSQGELYGLEGITAGLALITRLLASFWPTLWPPLDEDAQEDVAEMRLSRLQWLDGALSKQLESFPLTDDGTINLSVWQRVQYFERRVAADVGVRSALIGDGYFSMDACDNSIRASNPEGLFQRIAQLDKLNHQLSSLCQTAGELTSGGGDMMGITNQRLQEIAELLARFLDVVAPELSSGGSSAPHAGDAAATLGGNGLTDSRTHHDARAQAIGQLLKIANYFRRNEPTSPVPYLLERAARWANMGMTEWLKEMMEDNNTSALQEIMRVMKGREPNNPQED